LGGSGEEGEAAMFDSISTIISYVCQATTDPVHPFSPHRGAGASFKSGKRS
jgi:hypothetical protein